MDVNNTNSPVEINNFISNLSYDKSNYLQYHQFIVEQYFTSFPHARGLLVHHLPGAGKTILAASLAIHFSSKGKNVIVLTPKSLQNNFKQGVEQYIKNTPEKDTPGTTSPAITYLSLNANNILDQMGKIGQTDVNRQFEKTLEDAGEIIRRDNKLDDAFLIIDEVHNLSNGVSNGSKNAVGLYDLILNASNLQLILLTGTPIVNDPFEIGILFNMVKGYIFHGKEKHTLFPEIRDEFNEYFVDLDNMRIKNANMFKNRVYGLSTYYGPYDQKKIKQKFYPEEYKLKIERVPMSSEQFSRYDTARTKEKEEIATGRRSQLNIRFEKKSGSSTFRIASRQISNYVIPLYALGEIRGLKAREKFIDKITQVDLKNLSKFSPKFKQIISNINKYKGIQIIYSDFVNGEGINLFARVLDSLGYNQWTPTSAGGKWYSTVGPGSNKGIYTEGGLDIYDENMYREEISGGAIRPSVKKLKSYAIITGNVEDKNRILIQDYINQPENKHGKLVQLVLISGVGATGINIFRARVVHIMSPVWNYSLIVQITGRAVRFKGHEDLPKKQRNVQPYIYLSDYPVGYREIWEKKNKENIVLGNKFIPWEDTSDITLFKKSIVQKKLSDYFSAKSIQGSIDCISHTVNFSSTEKDRINCLNCQPTNEPLYHPSIPTQLKLPNPCSIYKPGTKTTAKQIIIDVDGEKHKFYYLYDKPSKGITVLVFNDNLDAYVPLKRDHPYFHDVYAVLEEKLLS